MGGKGVNGNLTPTNERSKNEAREMGRKGGKVSGEARRKKKTMREALEMLMFKVKLPDEHRQMLEREGFTEEDFNHQTVITRSLIAKAESGDVQAYNAICAMIGEKPAEKMEVSGDLLSHLRVVRESREDDPYVPRSEDEIPD